MTPDYTFSREEAYQCRLNLNSGLLARAFSHLRAASRISSDLSRASESLEARYFYMLRFIAGNNDMPDLEATLASIKADMRTLLHRIETETEAALDTTMASAQLRYARMRPEETLASLISDYLAELDRLKTDTLALTDTRRRAPLERLASDIFLRIWVEFPVSEETSGLLESIITDGTLPLHDRVMWLASLGLALQRYPIEDYFRILLAAHASEEELLSTTAAVWTVLSIRENLGADIDVSKLEDVATQLIDTHPDDIANVVAEWVRSLGTEQVSKEFREEIEPRLRGMGREFDSKLRDLDPEKAQEMLMNPEWLSEGISSEGFDSIKRFAEAQQKGDDVFMDTLGKIRSFDFFNTMGHWFLPFHPAHSSLAPVVDGEGAAIADTIARMPVLCDSDKYALLLTIAQTPAQMRSAALEAMSAQMYQASSSEEFQQMLNQASRLSRRALINNSVKNIYRFFRLFRAAAEFKDTLSKLPLTSFFGNYLAFAPDTELEIADSLFSTRRYDQACELYSAIDTITPLDAPHLRKAGFAKEMTGLVDEATEYYTRALALVPGDVWTALRLASAYDGSGQTQLAADTLLPLMEENSTNREYLDMLAHIYKRLGRWDDVVGVYHNIDYVLPEDDNSVKGDLAWALTVAGDYDMAEDMFSRAPVTPATMHRHAVLMWLTGRRPEAVALSAKADALAQQSGDSQTAFDMGLDYIIENHAGASTLPLMDEIGRYQRYGSDFGNII